MKTWNDQGGHLTSTFGFRLHVHIHVHGHHTHINIEIKYALLHTLKNGNYNFYMQVLHPQVQESVTRT